MMKRLLFVIFAVNIAALVCAGPVSREQALLQAQQFFSQKGKSYVLKQAETQMTKARARGKQVPDYYYVFNAGNNQGFVIVSGDDRTPVVLGYSDRGSFNIDQIPSNMDAWLQGYADQIKYIQSQHIDNANRTRAIHRANVDPLLTSHWDQNSPFNDDCGFDLPSLGRIDAVTGCVSTAMSQVMYYYKYPAKTVAEVPAYTVTYNGTDKHIFESVPAGTVLDWDNMLDSYPINPVEGTEIQRAAVANLLAIVGKSVQTTYSNNNSAAYNASVADALKEYFGYAQNVAYKQRWGYTNDEWESILYQELSSGRPVVYGGQTSDDAYRRGHCFVLDGYQDGGYFHVNWGWGQLPENPDGFFLLSAMDPPVEGAGGGSGAYNYGQDAIVGIDYKDVGPVSETVRVATTSITVNGSTEPVTIAKEQSFNVSFNVVSRLINTYDINMSLGLYQDDVRMKNLGKIWLISNFSPNSYNSNPLTSTLDLSALENGRYRIIPISREDKTDNWYQNERSDEFFIEIEVTDTQIAMTIGNPEPEVSDAQRKELAVIYAALKKSVEAKQASVIANETEIAALKDAVEVKNSQITELKKKIAAIEEKLKSDWLTEVQKTEYTETLSSLSQSCIKIESDISDIIGAIATLESTVSTLKTQLATIMGSLNTQAAAVADIETLEALTASQTSANELKTQIEGCDVSTLSTQIDTVKKNLSDVSLAETDTAIKELDQQVDDAIEKAKAEASEEEKEKAKLEAAKKEVQASIDALKTKVAAAKDKIAKGEVSLTELVAAIKKGEEILASLKEKAAELDILIAPSSVPFVRTRSDMTDEQRAAFAEKLQDIQAKIKELEEKLAVLANADSSLESMLINAKDLVQTIEEGISSTETSLTAVTTVDAAKALKETVSEFEMKLSGVDTTADQALADITTQDTEMSAFLVEASAAVDNATAIIEDVQNAISGIGSVMLDESDIYGRYDLNGHRVDENYKGVMIIRMNNGKTHTIIKRK